METNQTQQSQTYENDEIVIDLKELFFVLLHRLWLIVLVGILSAAAAWAFTINFITPLYQSTSLLYILNQSDSNSTSLSDVQVGTQLTEDYAQLIKGRPVIEEVIEELSLNGSYEQLYDMVSVNIPDNTRIVNITVTSADPVLAQKIAAKLAHVSAEKIASIMRTDEPSIYDEGHVAESASSPNVIKNCVLAALAGMVLTVMLCLVIYMLNDKIKTQEDVEKYLGLIVLGTIPKESRKERKRKQKEIKKLERQRKQRTSSRGK